MYQITDSILKSGVYSALTEPTREFQQRISFGEGLGVNFIKHISFIKGITKIEISQEGNSDSSGLVLGSCCASSCVAEFYNPDKTYNYAGKTMFIECGVKYPFKVSYENKTGGYYMTSNGKWVDGENVYSKVTNLIPVFEGDSFFYTGRGEWGAASVLWYDENKKFLSGEEYYSEDTRDHVTTVTIEAPDGAAWAVFQTFDYDSEVTLEVSKANDSFFYIPCGYYKVDKPETDDDWRTVSITAYDCIDEMTGKWNTSLSMPSNAYLLLEEIATRYGLALDVESGVLAEMKSRTVTEAQALVLTAYTEREVCGFLAGLFGANARINTVGKLAVKRYQNSPTDDFCILAAVQWQNGFKKSSEEEFVVNSVTSGIDDAVFTAGTGAGISFANPIITEDEISAVYDVYADVSFQPSSCEWRGNPCVECGDTVAVTDRNGNSYTVLVASQVIDLTGGLSMNTHCPGGDSEISFDTVDERTRAALNRQYTALQQAIIDASNALNGARGGYYEVLDNDNDGNPDGWLIKQFQDGSGGLIRANYEGIGLSLDGGKTYRTAIGFEGINADCITTGKLNAERIDTSTLVVGLGNVEGLDTELKTLLQATEDAESKATNAQSTADATNLILSGITAQENGVTVVKGSTILTGSIGAAQIASESITADKLSVGTGIVLNQYYNNEFYDGTRGWIAEYSTLQAMYAGQSVAHVRVTPNGTSGYGLYQKMWLENGRRYAIVAQILPLNWSQNATTKYIRHILGSEFAFSVGQDLSTAYNDNGETVIKIVYDYTGETGFTDVGLGFRGLLDSSGNCVSLNVAWMAFVTAEDETPGFYCSRKSWLASGYKESNYLSGSVGGSTTAESYLTKNALSVDTLGNLVTLGTIKSNNGEIGSMVFNPERMDIATHSYHTFAGISAFVSSRISFVLPPNYSELTGNVGYNPAEYNSAWSAKIEVASDSIVDGVDGSKEHSMITSSGFSVVDVSIDENGGTKANHYAITAYGIYANGKQIDLELLLNRVENLESVVYS